MYKCDIFINNKDIDKINQIFELICKPEDFCSNPSNYLYNELFKQNKKQINFYFHNPDVYTIEKNTFFTKDDNKKKLKFLYKKYCNNNNEFPVQTPPLYIFKPKFQKIIKNKLVKPPLEINDTYEKEINEIRESDPIFFLKDKIIHLNSYSKLNIRNHGIEYLGFSSGYDGYKPKIKEKGKSTHTLKELRLFGRFREYYLCVHHTYARVLGYISSGYTDHWVHNSFGKDEYIEAYKLPVKSIITVFKDVKKNNNERLPNLEGAYPIGNIPDVYLSYNVFKVKKFGDKFYWSKFTLGYDNIKNIDEPETQYYKIIDGWAIRTGVCNDGPSGLSELTKKIKEYTITFIDKKLENLWNKKYAEIVLSKIKKGEYESSDKIENINKKKLLLKEYTYAINQLKKNNKYENISDKEKKKLIAYVYYSYDFEYNKYSIGEHASWFSNLKDIEDPIKFIEDFINLIVSNLEFNKYLSKAYSSDDYKYINYNTGTEYEKNSPEIIYNIQREFIIWREEALNELLNPPLYV